MTGSIGLVERMRWMSALLSAAVLALMVAVGLHSLNAGAPAAGAGGSSATLDPRIAALADHHPGRSIEAIVQFSRGVSVAQAQAEATEAGGQVVGELHIIDALAIRLTAAQARTLAGDAGVHSVSLNTTVTPSGGPLSDAASALTSNLVSNSYTRALGATALWRFGLTGRGVGVAVIDTGIDGDLPDFRGDDGRSRVVETAVVNQGASTVQDTYGHGTDVAGIIAGNSSERDPSDPLRGRYMGVAPDANLVSIKVSDDAGQATVLDVIYGLQFAVDHRADDNIRVVNLSLDSTTPQSYKTDPLDAAVEAAWMQGIAVVAAAGNRGSADDAVQFAPANDPYVITVGATDSGADAGPADATVASFSSRGVTQDGFAKPEVYAPGAHIVSVLAPHSTFSDSCGSCIVDGQYIQTSGTSMAAPMVSGVIADVLQLHPDWTPNQIKGALTSPVVKALPQLQVVNAARLALTRRPEEANRGLEPSSLITNAEGKIDYKLSSWSFSSWSVAKGSLNAGFAMSSWSCASCTADGNGGVDPTMSSWSMSSWSTYLTS